MRYNLQYTFNMCVSRNLFIPVCFLWHIFLNYFNTFLNVLFDETFPEP